VPVGERRRSNLPAPYEALLQETKMRAERPAGLQRGNGRVMNALLFGIAGSLATLVV
jgi:hypothetical protein